MGSHEPCIGEKIPDGVSGLVGTLHGDKMAGLIKTVEAGLGDLALESVHGRGKKDIAPLAV